ncbi:MAG: hypothetical protein LCI02_07880 [Proteobacteria bacterium]|nr:hypothetical protein [Pseudomonadota bacterium]
MTAPKTLPKKKRIIVIGGISVNDAGGHDKSPWNFINPGLRRAKALATSGQSVEVLFYAPSYERRARAQKTEADSVDNPQKNAQYFESVVKNAADKNGYTVTKISSSHDLTTRIAANTSIQSVEYFGHSNDHALFLEYSSVKPGTSTDSWGIVGASSIPNSNFTEDGYFASYGCNQGEKNGLMQHLRAIWNIRTIGAVGKTDYEAAGVFGGPTYPSAGDRYVEFPAPDAGSSPEAAKPQTIRFESLP